QWNDPVRTGVVGTQHRDSVRQYQPGEGTRRARSSYAAGSSGEGAETRQDQHDRGGKRVSAQLRRKMVDIYDFPDGRLEVRGKGRSLPYSAFDKLQRVSHAAIVENKRLGRFWSGS